MDNPWNEIQRAQEQLDFAFRIIRGIGFPIYKITDTKTPLNESVVDTNRPIHSQREITTLDRNALAKIKYLLKILIDDKFQPKYKLKIECLRFFLNTAMSCLPIAGLTGAFYITILESIFAPDNAPEIGYRFKMRLTKMHEEGTNYAKKVNDLYANRSSIFHGNKDKFKKEDLMFLEETVAWAIEKFLIAPEKFDTKELDKQILN